MTLDHVDAGDLENLAGSLRGPLIQPTDDGYDEARRVYNAMHDRRPALIVQAADVADVIAAVNFAREQGLALALRGGGHSVPGFGTCDDGLVLDLGRMKGIRVDQAGKAVRAEGGCTLGELDHAVMASDHDADLRGVDRDDIDRAHGHRRSFCRTRPALDAAHDRDRRVHGRPLR